MEGVIVQRIDNVHDTMWRIHTDHRTVYQIWHRSVESPVPVRDPEGGGHGLILTSLGCWVRCGDLLCVVPEDLLSCVSYRAEFGQNDGLLPQRVPHRVDAMMGTG